MFSLAFAVVAAVLLAVAANVPIAGAAENSGRKPPGPNPDIIRAIREVGRLYGPDAILLQSYLLGHAIQEGSVLEAAIGVAGIQNFQSRKYLTFKLETGIVYNDRELSPDARLTRTWSRIVERSLRKFRSIVVPADGLAFAITYFHKAYIDEPDLRAHLRDGHGEEESALFYLLSSDVNDLVASRITSQGLADRATVLVNGSARHVQVETPEATIPAPAQTPP
jgi:hypothetical protein